jgi:hypothetical protein
MTSRIQDTKAYTTRTASNFCLLCVLPVAIGNEVYFLFEHPFGDANASQELEGMKGELATLEQQKEAAPNDTISIQITTTKRTTYDYAAGHGMVSNTTDADTVLVTHTGLVAEQKERIASHAPAITDLDFFCGVGGSMLIALSGTRTAYIFKRNLAMLRAKVTGNKEMQEALRPSAPTPN